MIWSREDLKLKTVLKLGASVALCLGALAHPAFAEDNIVKIGVVAAESGSFVRHRHRRHPGAGARREGAGDLRVGNT
jgi:branched-chain amino acid transport system substrate-binding protein